MQLLAQIEVCYYSATFQAATTLEVCSVNKQNVTANFDIFQLFIDNIVILISYCIANLTYEWLMDNRIFQAHIWVFVSFALIFTLSMLFMRMYNVTTFCYIDRIVKRTFAATIVAGLNLSLIIFMAKADQASRLLFVLFCSISCMLVVSERIIIRISKKRHWGNGYSHILFIGDDQTLARYAQFIDMTSIKLKIERFVSYNDACIRTTEAFSQLLMSLTVDEVHFVLSFNQHNDDIQSLLEIFDSMGVTARSILDTFELPVSKSFVSSIGTYPVLTYHSVSQKKFQLFIKSVIDMVGAAVGLVMLTPVFLLTAIAIKLDSPGPVFFKQKRVGTYGKIFQIYKFRSMHIDAEARKQDLEALNKIKDGMMFKIDNDPRITRVGAFIRKTSIDELPQLLNVIKRDMSLVGTRPPTMEEVNKYAPEHWRRISIQPGITGMWQVNGRSQIFNFDDVVRLDKKYIDEWTLLLDIKILLKTVKVVLSSRGAY